MFADRVKNLTESGIRRAFDLAAKMKNPINFSIGQPDFEVPDVMKKAAIEAIQKGYNRYSVTQGIEPLRARLSEELKKTKNFVPDGLMITSGTSGGLLLLLEVLVNPGEEILLPDPYFVMYNHLANLVGAIPKYYDLHPDFQIRPEKIEELITPKTKLLIVNSPSNPTGAVFSKESLQKIANIAKKHNLLVVSDEIYDAFVYDCPHESITNLYPKTILLGGFSKTYGAPGWRMGYAAGPKDIIEKMKTLQQFSYVCAPTPFQYGCLQAFDVDMSPYIQSYKKKRDIIVQNLLENGFRVIKPGGSFYIYPEAPGGNAEKFCEAAIQEELLIIPGTTFSSRNTHFRISFAVEDSVITRGLDVLAKLAKKFVH